MRVWERGGGGGGERGGTGVEQGVWGKQPGQGRGNIEFLLGEKGKLQGCVQCG